jgi:N-acetyl-anhydromuramyl-L-alanine amidase AmpD
MFLGKKIGLGLAMLFLLTGLFLWAIFFFTKKAPIFIESPSTSFAEDSLSMNQDQNSHSQITNTDRLVNSSNSQNQEPPNFSPPKKEPVTSQPAIIKKLVSWGYSSTNQRAINTIIIHSSYNALDGEKYDLEKLLEEYRQYGVAPHYLIDREGNIYQLVADKDIAYHAGESRTPDGKTGVNNFSLGIELMNTEKDSCASTQYSSLKKLLFFLKETYSIKYVLGHNDIAPGRKTDPWNFDWSKIK